MEKEEYDQVCSRFEAMANHDSRSRFELFIKNLNHKKFYYLDAVLTRDSITGDYLVTWVDAAWMGWCAAIDYMHEEY